MKRIPHSLLRGFHALAKPDPKGQNYVIPRLLAAGIGILRVLQIYLEGDLFGNVFQKGNLCILLVDCNSDKNNV